MRPPYLTSGFALLSAIALAACGQKGPLYLPEPPGEVVTRPAPPAEPAPAQTPPRQERDDEEQSEPPP